VSAADVAEPTVLLMDHLGYWAPLADLYFSMASNALVSRHPSACVDEVLSYYCPQCLSRSLEDLREFQHRCPSCASCPVCGAVVHAVGVAGGRVAYRCGYCCWTSEACGLVDDNRKALQAALVARERAHPSGEAMRALVVGVRTSEREASAEALATKSSALRRRRSMARIRQPRAKDTAPAPRWRLEDLERKLQDARAPRPPMEDSPLRRDELGKVDGGEERAADETAVLASPASSCTVLPERVLQRPRNAWLRSELAPVRVELRHKLTRRSRADRDAGRNSILVKPKPMPEEGDSVRFNKGQWWDKISAGVHWCPRIVVKRIPRLEEMAVGPGLLMLTINNPHAHSDVTVTLRPSPPELPSPGHSPVEAGAATALRVHVPNGYVSLALGPHEEELLREDARTTADNAETPAGGGGSSSLFSAKVRGHMAVVRLPVELPEGAEAGGLMKLGLELGMQLLIDDEQGELLRSLPVLIFFRAREA